MVNHGQTVESASDASGIVDVGYRPPDDASGEVGGCEPLTVARLRQRAAPDTFATMQRLDLHLLLCVTAGAGEHVVDFETVPVRPGTLLWVRPGQVHRWGDMRGYEGHVVLFAPDYLDHERDLVDLVRDPFGARVLTGPPGHPIVRRVADLVEVASCPELTTVQRDAVMRHLLGAILIELEARASTPSAAALPPAFVRLRSDIERHFARDHDVETYASRLGYSARTLTRATRQATGRTPKELIDARVVLEARRLLAHSDLSVARVGAQVGFDDPANFSKFFRHRTGVLPGAFRTRS